MSCWQDPLRGGRDKMLEEIASVIHSEDPDVSADQLVVPAARRLVPEFMLKLAGRVSPFWRWWWFVIAARTRCNCKDYCTLGGSSLSLIGSCIRGVFLNEEKYFWSLISDSIPKQCFKGGKARRDELGTPAQSRWEATDLLYTSCIHPSGRVSIVWCWSRILLIFPVTFVIVVLYMYLSMAY